MSQPPTHDDPRDAHLLAALRHAPDRDVQPPAQVTAAILGQARESLRPQPGGWPAWREGLRSVLARLWQPAPMAAFGTLAMATLIGVMWGGQDVPDAAPSLRPAPAVAPPAPASAVGGLAAATPPPESTRVDAKVAAAEAAPAPATPAPAAARVAEALPQREARGTSLADAMPAAARARSEAEAPAIGATASPNARAGAAPLASVGAEIDAVVNSEPARVRWRVAEQRLVAHDAAQRQWWSTLVQATQGRWQPAPPGSASGAESEPITLLIDGAPRGSLSFEPQALVWRDANGAAWRAPIAAETLRGLQETLARW